MGFGYIIAGFLFFVNPIIHVIDIFPDFIGFFLICKGLNKLSYLNSSVSEARDIFRKLGFVELIRICCIVFIAYVSSSALLLFAFVFGVIELIYFIPAVNYLFDGITYLGMKYDGNSIFLKTKKKKELVSVVKKYTLVFYITRIVCTLIPELTSLQMYDHLGTVTALSINYSRYKPFLYIVLGTAVIVIGILWLSKVIKYFGAICKDKAFIDNLNNKYNNDVSVKTNLFTAKRMKTALLLYIIAVITSFCLYIEGINIIIGVISSLFIVAAALIVKKYVKLAYAVFPLCALRSILSIVNLILQKIYFFDNQYNEIAVDWMEKAHDQYYRMAMFVAFENVAAIALFFVFTLTILKAVKLHLAQSGIQDNNVQYSKTNRDIEVYNTIGAKLLMNMIIMIINFVLAASYMYVMVNLTVIIAINSVVSIIWIIHSVSTVSSINDLLYNPIISEEF